jgi:hypothetical protein
MPKMSPKISDDEDLSAVMDDDSLDDEPIPARRDTRIFHRKNNGSNGENSKDEEFDEDIFV